jgi:hypothetical protein
MDVDSLITVKIKCNESYPPTSDYYVDVNLDYCDCTFPEDVYTAKIFGIFQFASIKNRIRKLTVMDCYVHGNRNYSTCPNRIQYDHCVDCRRLQTHTLSCVFTVMCAHNVDLQCLHVSMPLSSAALMAKGMGITYPHLILEHPTPDDWTDREDRETQSDDNTKDLDSLLQSGVFEQVEILQFNSTGPCHLELTESFNSFVNNESISRRLPATIMMNLQSYFIE